jgi:hypothetical protein
MIIRELPTQEYHDSPRVSASKLKLLEESGPRMYSMKYVSKTLPKSKRTAAMIRGEWFETYVQRPADFVKECPISQFDGRTKEGKAFAASLGDRDCLPESEFKKFPHMAEALKEHELLQRLIDGCEQQVTLTCAHRSVELQSRPDWINILGCPASNFHPYEINLKTTSEMTDFIYETKKYRYGGQAAIVRETCEQNNIVGLISYAAVVEVDLPHRVKLFRYTPETIAKGWEWASRLLGVLDGCVRTNDWPRAEQGVIEI